ncbi:MAG: iron chelate uptake ABC transporter family permease subunit, partial [Proteobacteria bacterium]|nr:iron chelate uptake ABC transporter family permease subunit [Pseudomonadota bacterium]
METTPVLTVNQLRKDYDSKSVLSPLDHTFKQGCWTFIIGPNGAGKSTLLKLLACLETPTGGEIRLGECALAEMTASERARMIAYVPQRLEAVPALTVWEFVCQGAYAWLKLEPDEMRQKRAMQALEALGLTSYAERKLDKLSGGELQLCVLASALVQNARILLLDEPTSALDLKHAELFCQAVAQLKSQDITIISTTHDLTQAARYADDCILLKEGECLFHESGLPNADLLANAYEMPAAEFERFCTLERADIQKPQCIQQTTQPAKMHHFNWVWLIIVTLVIAFICPFFGASWSTPFENGDIFVNLRIPRVLWGAIAGATLSMVGGVLQALFHNPLATPYTLGIASGASLGAMAAIQIGIAALWSLPIAACTGGLICMAAVLMIASRTGLRQPITCLMAGVAVSMFCSAAGLIIQAFATPLTAHQMMRWQLGGLEIVGYTSFISVPIILAGLIGMYALHKPLNLM